MSGVVKGALRERREREAFIAFLGETNFVGSGSCRTDCC